jgi:hypothetical protein
MFDKVPPPIFIPDFLIKPRIIESTVPTEPSVYLVYLLYYELYGFIWKVEFLNVNAGYIRCFLRNAVDRPSAGDLADTIAPPSGVRDVITELREDMDRLKIPS